MKTSSLFRFWAPTIALGAATLAPAVHTAFGQSPQSAVQSSLEKAHQLEVLGRMDLAEQAWQQVLLADPNNTQALGGVARAEKSSGHPEKAQAYLDRLRRISPNDPEIARIETMGTVKDNNNQLKEAGRLAQEGKNAQAMEIYRKLYGNNPPAGDLALSYYETEAGTEEGRPAAVAGLRGLAEKYPNDPRYQITLGRILTYNPKTRAEGRKILEQHTDDPRALEALRNALLYDAANPAMAPAIRAYLAQHPDAQLEQILRAEPRNAGRVGGGRARPMTAEERAAAAAAATRSAADRAAYAQLNAKHIAQAEEQFKAILAEHPDDANALAGMGYVRMQQANFAGALNFLVQAREDGSKDPGLAAAIATSQFWNTMAIGAAAAAENDLPTSEHAYRAAVAMRPASPEALEALGGILLRAQQPDAAAPFFIRFIKVSPNAPHAWRGLFLAQSQGGDTRNALLTERQMPASVRAELAKDPLYLRQLASTYTSAGRDADAQRVLKAALDLPFPADASRLETETQLQYASLLAQANRLDQAASLYRMVLAKDQNNVTAWQGLVRAEHTAGLEREALATLESAPPRVFQLAMQDAGFESTVAAIYQSQNRLDVAQDILEKSIAQQVSAGQKPSLANEIQLAGIYLQRNQPQLAYPVYRQILTQSPDRLDAWKGLLTALHSTERDQDALAQVQQIPEATRVQLEQDPQFLQTVGAIYNGLGQPREAQLFLHREQQHYLDQHTAPPADVDIQNGWLLYNAGNDQALYRQLMSLGNRNDLTAAQRRTVQTIWANWAVRRANQAAAAGNERKALAILNATTKAFPDNPGVVKALAGGYARAGMPQKAVAIWKQQDLSAATATDYRAAIGAALAAGDSKDAETWLRFALNSYPKDADLLILGAKFEQARGDTSRAADYYRASLNAMPPADPGAELATELSRPVAADGSPLQSMRAGQDLATLMKPGPEDSNAVQQQFALPPSNQPYLPSGSGSGYAPVMLNGQPSSDAPMVPSSMGSPSNPPAAPAAKTRLRDYVPQSSVEEPLVREPNQSRGVRVYADYDPAPSPRTSHAAYMPAVFHPGSRMHVVMIAQVQQASPATQNGQTAQQATQGEQYLPYKPQQQAAKPLTTQPTGSAPQQGSTATPPPVVYGPYVPLTKAPPASQSPATAPAQTTSTPPAPSVVYGPYVPYQPPAQPAPVPPANAVQLGSTPPVRTIQNPPVTDVLPTARYVPNAKVKTDATSQTDPKAAAAAAARRRAATAAARTGESKPPAEVYQTAPTDNATYAPGTQVAQPAQGKSSLPAADQTYGPYRPYRPAQNGDDASSSQQYPQPGTTPGTSVSAGSTVATRGRARSSRRPATTVASTPETTAPAAQPAYQGMSYPGVGEPLGGQPYPSVNALPSLGPIPTDADLTSQHVPALGGRYAGDLLQPQVALTPRQQTERDLATLEASYSGWLGGTASARYRSGTAGYDQLTDLEAVVEASATVGDGIRFTVVPKAVFLNSGTFDVTPYTGLTTGYPVLGTFQGNAVNAPAQQSQSGIGGEFQVSTRNFAAALGYTPYEFLVQNVTGRVLFKPNAHVTLFGDRSPVTETELSYAGLRDPGTTTISTPGNIWGGVVSTGGGVRFDVGDERAGFYVTADGADLTGYHVLENYKFEGSAGAYFLAHTFPGVGRLNVGASIFGMHYNYNERGLTYGLGGYFSPTAYFLASVPITFTGHYLQDFHYSVAASVGVQTFQEASQAYFPLDRFYQSTIGGSMPTNSNTGGNYSINAEGSYRIVDHWYAGGFLSANNTNNYNTTTGGFFVRYLFRPQYGNDDYPTGIFPVDGFRPLRVP
jgi:tetratricopeptide (TPR) repeat protein